MLTYRVISIGTLAAHPLWNESGEVRTGHATTTLITAGDANILVDPSLPPQILFARLSERTNIKPDAITHVFLTSYSKDRRRTIGALGGAAWLMHEPEREDAAAQFNEMLARAEDEDDSELEDMVRQELERLAQFQEPDDRLAPGVDLFPLPGVTPGTCGLLLALPASTVLICGDAIPTVEHLDQGKVLQSAKDIETAQESFREAIEIADALVLGRDNIVFNPVRRMM